MPPRATKKVKKDDSAPGPEAVTEPTEMQVQPAHTGDNGHGHGHATPAVSTLAVLPCTRRHIHVYYRVSLAALLNKHFSRRAVLSRLPDIPHCVVSLTMVHTPCISF